MLTTNANHTVCGHCGGLVKGTFCWMDGKAYHDSCYSLLMGVERGLKSVCVDKDAEIAWLRATVSRLRAELAELLAAIEAMRVAGGAAEFQRAFDEAKIIAARKGEVDEPAYARRQPCGCVLCVCEDEIQCQGCGAVSCGTHPSSDRTAFIRETRKGEGE